MRWSRIKNIIILLLVLVNIFLLFLVGQRAWHTEQAQRETRRRMVDVLANNGIAYLPQEVPGEMPLTGRQIALSQPDEARVSAFLGGEVTAETSGGRTLWRGPAGTLSVASGGELEAELTAVELLRPQGLEDAAAGTWGETWTEGQLLALLGLEVRRDSSPGSEEASPVFLQLWEGAPVLSARLTVEWGETVRISGRALFGAAQPAPAAEFLSASTALTRFLKALNDGGYVCSRIADLYPGYLSAGAGTTTLAPAWLIETDAWPWRFAVDAATGAVTAEP